MFDQLTDKLEGIFKKLRGHCKLSEANIEEANVKGNEVLLSCPFRVQFTLWLFVQPSLSI